MITLRPYQEDAVASLHKSLATNDSTMMVMPTGSGKSVVVARHIADSLANGCKRVLVLTPRRELVWQIQRHIETATGQVVDVEMADERADRRPLFVAPVVAGTVATQVSVRDGFRRYQAFDPYQFDLVWIDECHKAINKTTLHTLDHYRQNPKLKVAGCTATPRRKDEKALGRIFGDVCYVYEPGQAVEDGWLVPLKQFFPELISFDYSLSGNPCTLSATETENEKLFEEALQKVATCCVQHAGDRRTLVFVKGVKKGRVRRLAEIFNRGCPDCAGYVTGAMSPDVRAEAFDGFRDGRQQFLINHGVVDLGFDMPAINCVAQALPTGSWAVHHQQLGRGGRPLPGVVDGPETPELRRAAIAASAKPDCLVLDFVDNATKHTDVPSAIDLLGGKYDDEIIALAVERTRESQVPVDVIEALREAERELFKRRREEDAKRREHIRAKADFRLREFDRQTATFATPGRVYGWDTGQKPSQPQVDCLLKFRVYKKDIAKLNKGTASALIGTLIERGKKRLPSYRQANQLRSHGHDPDMPMDKARPILDDIAKREWRR